MKKYIIIFFAAVALASCGNTGKNDTAGTEAPAHEDMGEATAPVAATADIDPICKMERDATWTDYTVEAAGDTTWFCSATCKETHDARKKQ